MTSSRPVGTLPFPGLDTLRHQPLHNGPPLSGTSGTSDGLYIVPGTATDQGVDVVGTCPGNCFYSPRIVGPQSHAAGLALLSAPTIPLYMNIPSFPTTPVSSLPSPVFTKRPLDPAP